MNVLDGKFVGIPLQVDEQTVQLTSSARGARVQAIYLLWRRPCSRALHKTEAPVRGKLRLSEEVQSRRLTQDAHHVLPLPDLLRHCLVAFLESALLVLEDLAASRMRRVGDVLHELHLLARECIEHDPPEPSGPKLDDERKEGTQVANIGEGCATLRK